jgi:hypothetical protein
MEKLFEIAFFKGLQQEIKCFFVPSGVFLLLFGPATLLRNPFL